MLASSGVQNSFRRQARMKHLSKHGSDTGHECIYRNTARPQAKRSQRRVAAESRREAGIAEGMYWAISEQLEAGKVMHKKREKQQSRVAHRQCWEAVRHNRKPFAQSSEKNTKLGRRRWRPARSSRHPRCRDELGRGRGVWNRIIRSHAICAFISRRRHKIGSSWTSRRLPRDTMRFCCLQLPVISFVSRFVFFPDGWRWRMRLACRVGLPKWATTRTDGVPGWASSGAKGDAGLHKMFVEVGVTSQQMLACRKRGHLRLGGTGGPRCNVG